MKKLNKKEKKLIRKCPNMFNNPLFLGEKRFDYRIVNGTPVWNVTMGGSINYQPDFLTIGLTANNEIGVLNYVSKTYVDTQDNAIRQWCENTFFLESAGVELDERVHDVENKLTLPTEQGDVILDYDDNNHLYGELAQDVSNKINNSLQTPITTPINDELVGIDTNRNQTRITIGEGLTIENHQLKATGGEQPHLYKHNVLFNSTTCSVYFSFDTTDETEITSTTELTKQLRLVLSQIEIDRYIGYITGCVINNEIKSIFYNIQYIQSSNGIGFKTTDEQYNVVLSSISYISDNVKQIF